MNIIKLNENNILNYIQFPDFGNIKGNNGYSNITIFGGSEFYSGAPYFSAISSLRVGANMIYIFTEDACVNILKSFSPDYAVKGIFNHKNMNDTTKNMIVSELIYNSNWSRRILIGPGLDKDFIILDSIIEILKKKKYEYIILDAYALKILNIDKKILNGMKNVVITPNIKEFKNIYQLFFNDPSYDDLKKCAYNLSKKMGNINIILKGKQDIITNGQNILVVDDVNNPKRVAGQGDILAGMVSYLWNGNIYSLALASIILRKSANIAFNKYKISIKTSDIIDYIHITIDLLNKKV